MDQATTQTEYFEAHADADGNLTDEQMAVLLTLPEGDTGTEPDSVDATPSPTTVNESDKGQAAGSGQPQVVLAKDGIHTIPYETLENERRARQDAQAQIAQLQAALAEAQQRADAGQAPTAQDKAAQAAAQDLQDGKSVDLSVFGDFDEEGIATGIDKIVEAKIAEKLAQMDQKLKPIEENRQKQLAQEHFNRILTAHPDANQVADSPELATWIEKQPTFVRNAYLGVLQQGTADQVVELLDTYKAQSAQFAKRGQGNLAQVAQQRIAQAHAIVPSSLSDIPGSVDGSRETGAEALMNMSEAARLDHFMKVGDPAAIEAMMRRLL